MRLEGDKGTGVPRSTSDHIAVSARVVLGGAVSIWIVDVAGVASPKELTLGFNPAWSPTDDRIAFNRFGRRHQDLHVIDVDGSGDVLLIAGRQTLKPHAPNWLR